VTFAYSGTSGASIVTSPSASRIASAAGFSHQLFRFVSRRKGKVARLRDKLGPHRRMPRIGFQQADQAAANKYRRDWRLVKQPPRQTRANCQCGEGVCRGALLDVGQEPLRPIPDGIRGLVHEIVAVRCGFAHQIVPKRIGLGSYPILEVG